ncbi:replication-associated recombination protein A [Orrella daihaiensis]|uniref:Replication-associated recombination protein A n=1 Tax=Orrella daihaiensis TaxID=2782176 RepID=A0ABY4AN39_9BURK|nr:replication-associated recombination protein A [Orrella daihaiensis]UOD51378.1 replication-associated recombination protein A [Orrella daihaiensis]
MADLFSREPKAPLAEQMRPRTLDDVVGQQHLIGPGKPLRIAFEAGEPHSMILWGPPGVGKTTLARLMADLFDCAFIAISAVFAGVKDIRAAMDQAQQTLDTTGRQTLLFVDEIHRFNKSQQDALLPFVESGLVVFVGATTENPGFEVNRALLSRAQVHVLKAIEDDDLRLLARRALAREQVPIELDAGALNWLVTQSDGDARRLLNQLEIVLQSFDTGVVDEHQLASVLSQSGRAFDKGGDNFYDQISALHKSVRGSDPDAALYWLARMLDGGADARYLARRIIRMAWEDIGLADPRAIQIAHDAADAFDRLGSPEGELALGQAVIYLSVAAKSNAGYKAYNQARAFVAQDRSREVPNHLRNAPTKLAKDLGHSQGYRYAHDEPDGFAAGQRYLPDDMPAPDWYQPVNRGLEINISQKLRQLRELDEQARMRDSDAEG